MMDFLTKMFGSKHDRDVKKSRPIVSEINAIFKTLEGLSDDALRAKTTEFRDKLAAETKSSHKHLKSLGDQLPGLEGSPRQAILDQVDETDTEIKEIEADVLDEILPEAFAVFKESCRRMLGTEWERAGEPFTWDMVPYDVQLIGGMSLHQGKIAEMATGEGKTLVAGLAMYLNGLTGRGVHLVTVNSYLAKRDAMWIGPLHVWLGLTVGVIQDRSMGAEAYLIEEDEKQAFRAKECDHATAYTADITYGTKDQFGFDYLYDNMSVRPEDLMQRGYAFAIIDEADSILIDEARTPLIISGAVPESNTERFDQMRPLVEKLIKAQSGVVNGILTQAENAMDIDEYEAGLKLLQVSRGAPRNKRFMKLLQEEGAKQLIGRVEADYIRDKRMGEVDADLFFSIDEKSHIIDLTEKGREEISRDPDEFVLPDLDEKLAEIKADASFEGDKQAQAEDEAYQDYGRKSERIHSVQQLLKGYALYEKDVQYVIDEGRVVIVDEFTGRPQPGRRFSDGLHQALEAKERVRVERDTQTVATITLQNYFRLYDKLSGMTGTAETEAGELMQIYKLDVLTIPTHEPVRRVDYDDLIYRTKREKYNAIVEEVERLHANQIPVLVGTITVEVSELLSRMLNRKGVKHSVLNARHNEQEAEIVRGAGQPGAVTIATNMAGRGTDIKLGPGIVKAPNGYQCALIENRESDAPLCPHLEEYGCKEDVPCGLHIIGTERHEARRIDRQLRGRSGRQGDPGSSRFFISLEDNLMRLFGSERIARIMDRLGAEEGEVIEHSMVTRSIGRAQKRVEGRNFEIRKHLLEYDDVMNQQREVIYDRRRHALEEDDISDEIVEVIEDAIQATMDANLQEDAHPEDWNIEALALDIRNTFLQAPIDPDENLPTTNREELVTIVRDSVRSAYKRREDLISAERLRQIERMVYLSIIDEKWKEHLREMDDLKEGIGLRGYGQKDPLLEYKREGFQMFVELLSEINRETVKTLFRIRIDETPIQRQSKSPQRLNLLHQDAAGMGFAGAPEAPPMEQTATNASEGEGRRKQRPVKVEQKVGRNDPCPCGSGKKYKRCHGS
ncbi:MAG: preprotein translocase subunit SecA [Candidatus Latescibacterota bacterium]|nr:preprotein translocase subunit SecA [Candidatus Latescibacterota bacterium]